MRSRIVQQFKHPRGLLGRMAGWIMAHRDSNRRRNAWAVSLLHIEPHHRVLELGCGPGLAIDHAARHVTTGRIVGVDHSELMVSAARKRNADAVREGRVEVLHGTAESILDRGEPFDRVLAVNVAQFWDDPARIVRELRSAMTPGGVIAVAFQPRNKGASDDDARRGAARHRSLLEEAGFTELRTETLDLTPAVMCVLGSA